MNAALALEIVIALPLAAAMLIYLIGRLYVRRYGVKVNPARWLTLAALAAEAVFVYFAADAFLSGRGEIVAVGEVVLGMDGISIILSALATGLGIVVTLFSFSYMRGEEGEEKFYALLTVMIGTIIGLGCTTDLFNLWVWFETMAVSSYMLVAFYRHQPAALEAGVKYLVQSAAGSVLVLLGIALVFAQTGTLNIESIHAQAANTPLMLAAGALFLIGFGVKTAMVPMHTWLPDAHSQAPSGISAMLSGVVIETGLVAMIRALQALAGVTSAWGGLLLAFGVINMFAGNLLALRQTQVKRLLAYSSLAHIGYILTGIGLAVTFRLTDAANGAFFHLLTHGLMKGLAFLSAGALLYVLYMKRGKHGPLTIGDLNGAARRYPLAALAFSIAVLGLGGLPPLAGFMSKWQILVAGAEARNSAALVIVVLIAVNSVLSLGYYAPLVNRLYRHQAGKLVLEGAKMDAWISIPLVLLALAVVVLGFWPSLANFLTIPAGASLLAGFGG